MLWTYSIEYRFLCEATEYPNFFGNGLVPPRHHFAIWTIIALLQIGHKSNWYAIGVWTNIPIFSFQDCAFGDIFCLLYSDVIMGALASQITSLTIVYSIVYSNTDQRKHQSSASLAFVRGIHRGPVNSPHKWPVARKMFPFDDDITWKRQFME